MAGNFKTKGAVAVAFTLFGTSFLFVNCHLTAHTENTKDRVKDLKKIKAVISLPKVLPLASSSYVKHVNKNGGQTPASGGHVPSKKRDFTDNFDVTFWCGDLNFRLEQTRDVVVREVLTDSSTSLDHKVVHSGSRLNLAGFYFSHRLLENCSDKVFHLANYRRIVHRDITSFHLSH